MAGIIPLLSTGLCRRWRQLAPGPATSHSAPRGQLPVFARAQTWKTSARRARIAYLKILPVTIFWHICYNKTFILTTDKWFFDQIENLRNLGVSDQFCTVYYVTRLFVVSSNALNSWTANVTLMHPKKIMQAQLRRRLAKAASELGQHYFLFHLAKTHKFSNIVDLFYSFISKIKYNIGKESSPKRQF